MNWLSLSPIPEIIFISLSRSTLWAKGNDELLWPFTWDNLPRLLSGSSLGWTHGRPRPRTWPGALTEYRVKMWRGRHGPRKRGKLAEACVWPHGSIHIDAHTNMNMDTRPRVNVWVCKYSTRANIQTPIDHARARTHPPRTHPWVWTQAH